MKTTVTVLVMGVCGAGKSLIGEKIADRIGAQMVEGDNHHTEENIRLMKAGIPLTDANRQAWLETLSVLIAEARASGKSLVVSCSALKRKYRDQLRSGDPALIIVYLKGDPSMIEERVLSRTGHFMPNTLVSSQFQDLEEPGADEFPIVCPITNAPEAIVQVVVDALPKKYG